MIEQYYFLWLSAISIIIGAALIKIIAEISRKKTTKKLGYGPIPWATWRIEGFTWPREYYNPIGSRRWLSSHANPKSLELGYKPEYKSKVAAWNTAYEEEAYKYRYLRMLSILLVIIGFFGFIYYIHLSIGF